MKNIILKNGLIGGIIVSLGMIGVTWFMKSNPNSEPNAYLGFATMFLAFAFVILGIKQLRELNNGMLNFKQGFQTGFLISLFISTIYVIVWLIIYYKFFPNFMEVYSELVIKNSSPEKLAANIAEMAKFKEWYKNPVMIILLTFIEILPIGIIITLFSAWILKRKPISAI